MRIISKKTAKRNPVRASYAFLLKNLLSNRLLDANFDLSCSSELPIDIVIPVTAKDIAVLPLVIKSVQTFVRHPINKFYIISPQVDAVGSSFESDRMTYFSDEEILHRPQSFFDYSYNGIDRSGWLKQQFIKLSGDNFCEAENYLVVDADTVFVRPLIFYNRDRYIMHMARSYHQPYYELFSRLLGYRRISALSFISHHMLFNRSYVQQMKQDIYTHTGIEWDAAIMKYINRDTISPFSEYETYGNYLFNRHPDRLMQRYYHGRNVQRPCQLPSLEEIQHSAGRNIKAVSFHS